MDGRRSVTRKGCAIWVLPIFFVRGTLYVGVERRCINSGNLAATTICGIPLQTALYERAHRWA